MLEENIFEKKFKEIGLLKHELSIVKKLQKENVLHIPNIIETTSDCIKYEYCGYNLQEYLVKCLFTFGKYTIASIAQELIGVVEEIHSCEIMHCDIKPSNLTYKNNEVYLIDFGASIDVTTHKLPKYCTPHYAAFDIKEEYLPKHDLEQVLFTLSAMYIGELPWFNECEKEYAKNSQVYSKSIMEKKEYFCENTFNDFVDLIELQTFCKYINDIGSNEIDYDYLKKLFECKLQFEFDNTELEK